MSTWFNISIALVVFMGLASGGMFSLVLMTNRKQQTPFSIILGLLLLIALLGAIGSVSIIHDLTGGLVNSIVLLILACTLGYALTTFSVLSAERPRPALDPSKAPPESDVTERTQVILLAPGEPPEYNTRHAARRLELADDPQDVPPLLLRPFYMRDIKAKYEAIRSSPYRESHIELARKVQSRLDATHRVTVAFYSDAPSLAESATEALQAGARHIIAAHVRVTDPPDSVAAGDLFEGLKPEQYGATVHHTQALWDSQLLPQIYVRRVIEALPHSGPDTAGIGLLIVGRGHIQSGQSSVARYIQESNYLRRVRDALLRLGFDESRTVVGWLRHSPTANESLQALVSAGARVVYCIPASFPADGINTMSDIPAQVDPIVAASGIKFVSLGAWNADDLAAEEIAAYIRAASPALTPTRMASRV
ncbi:MAG: hypothetical protein WCD37_17890 [Chloroflexia bacterium]